MKKAFTCWVILLLVCVGSGLSFSAEKRGKFGKDTRHDMAAKIKFESSKHTVQWKMVMPWSKSLLFYDIAVHFCDSVRLASGGRLDIMPFAAGEQVPAMQTLDAVSSGIAQAGHDWPGYWKGKNEAFVALGSVPFGLDGEGYNVWLYEKDGMDIMQELYGKFGLHALPGGQCGQEMGLVSNKKATKLEDLRGMRIRTLGWYGDILSSLGVSVIPLAGSKVCQALERGEIDAAEFSCPAVNYPMRFDEVTQYCIQPGIHQPGIQCTLFFNKNAYASLAEDLKWIIDIAAKETQLWSYHWMNHLNARAVRKFKENIEFVKLDKDTMTEIGKAAKKPIDSLREKHPDVKKVLDSQEAFAKEYADWQEVRRCPGSELPGYFQSSLRD